jgi:DNA-binding HxlR family transcriptional regulator
MSRAKKTKLVRRSDCAVACTLDIIEGIATNILSARLRALCEQGLVEKTPDPSDQRRYIYQLSTDGLHLRELLGNIAAWGQKHIPGTKIMSGFKPGQG